MKKTIASLNHSRLGKQRQRAIKGGLLLYICINGAPNCRLYNSIFHCWRTCTGTCMEGSLCEELVTD